MQTGKVYLVGAGPGHPELLTLKAASLLATADVIVYDRLVQEEVLASCKPSAERLYMGKAVGRHESRQDAIHELLLRKAREGKVVVRLKGGDPFVFGRGGEEAEFLADHGVPFEVVPGVSSALAAPASAGIAVTHRDAGSVVAIVTGHEANRPESRMNWDALAGIDTLVVLMSVSTVRRVAAELLRRGRNPDTPAAMVQMAFWHGERAVTATLATIADEVERANIQPPATLVIGEVVRLREKLQHSQRDLLRRPDDGSRFDPAPAPDQLMRLATGGVAAKLLRVALEGHWFDRLERWQTPAGLAAELRLNEESLAEALQCFVSLGLLESGEQGFRNLELASRYLAGNSAHSLDRALLYRSLLGTTEDGTERYLREGAPRQPDLSPDGLYGESIECLARFAAPLVLDKVGPRPPGRVLIAGWGSDSYRDAARARWPESMVDAIDLSANGNQANAENALPQGSYQAIVLSGLLAYCGRGEVQPLLEAAASRLESGGSLILHDSFVPADTVPPPEVVLAEFGRRASRGGCRNWPYSRLRAALEQLGLDSIRAGAVTGGSLVVAARKP